MYRLWPIYQSPKIKHRLPLWSMHFQPNHYMVRYLCQLPTRREEGRPIHLLKIWTDSIERPIDWRTNRGSFIICHQGREVIPNRHSCRSRCFDHDSFSRYWFRLPQRPWKDHHSTKCCRRRASCWRWKPRITSPKRRPINRTPNSSDGEGPRTRSRHFRVRLRKELWVSSPRGRRPHTIQNQLIRSCLTHTWLILSWINYFKIKI